MALYSLLNKSKPFLPTFSPSQVVNPMFKLLERLRYPFSLPNEVASDLGIDIQRCISFKNFLVALSNPSCCPKNLCRFMPRNLADKCFETAMRKEKFPQHSLYSYHFNGAWMEFVLHFDDQGRLRRLYLCHKDLKQKSNQVEIPLLTN
jgi:hypothetical protein